MANKETIDTAAKFWAESGNEIVESANKLNDIAQRAIEKTSEQNQNVFNQFVDNAVRTSKEFAEIRDVNAFVQKQIVVAQEAGQQFSAVAEAYADLIKDAQSDYMAWAQEAAKSATARFEKAGAQVA